MALYTVEAGDNIWNIADRSLGLRDGRSAAPPTNQEIADEMLRIIATNIGKLKVPKGSKGTPGPADLIHAGLVLDLGGAPSPSQAAEKGKQQKPTDLEREKTPGAESTDLEREKTPGARTPTDLEREKTPSAVAPNPGAPSGGREPGILRNPGAPTGGREPGWGGRDNSQREIRPVSPPRNLGNPTGGREPGWGGRDNGPQREVRPVSPPGRRPNPGAPTGGREPGWGGLQPRPARPNPGWGGREPAERPGGRPRR